MTQQTKVTEHTLLVHPLDMERLSHDLNEAVHKNHPEDKQTYKARARLAITLEPRPAMFDFECVGQTQEPFEIAVYGEGIENGKRYCECIPRYAFTMPLDKLKAYTKEPQTLVDFMGDNYRPNHHRIGVNIKSWLEYFNK